MTRQEIKESLKKKIDSETHGLTVCLDDPIFIGVSGNTYPYRDYLKGLGFQWNRNYKVWRLFLAADRTPG